MLQVTSQQVHLPGVDICGACCLCRQFLGGIGGAGEAGEMQFHVLITGKEVEFTLHLASVKPSNLAFDEKEQQVLARRCLREVHFLRVTQHVMLEACDKCVLHYSLCV